MPVTLAIENALGNRNRPLLLQVEHTLDEATWDDLVPTLSAARRGRWPLVLDLSRCSSIDSFGLRVVFRIYRELSAGDPSVPMAVVVGEPATKLISPEAIGMTIPLFPGREQALAWIESLSETDGTEWETVRRGDSVQDPYPDS